MHPTHTPLSLHNAQLNLLLDIQKAFQSSSLYEIWILEISIWILPQTLISCVTSGPASFLRDQFPRLSNQDDNFCPTKPVVLVQIGWHSRKSPLWPSMNWMTICRRHVLHIHHALSFWEMVSSLKKFQMSMRQQFLLQKWASLCIFVRHRKGHMVPWSHQGLLTLSYLNWEHRERLALHCTARQSIGTSGDEEAQFGNQTEKKSLSRWRSITKKDWGGCKRRHSWLQVSKRQRHGFSSPGQERWRALLFT